MASETSDSGAPKADQEVLWMNFYQRIWNARSRDLLKKMDEFPGNPFAALESFKRLDMRQTARHDNQEIYFREGKLGWLPTGWPQAVPNAFREEIVPQPFYANPVDFLLDYLDLYSFDAIVELGAGFGRNLFEIYFRGGPQNIPYYCGELTPSGIELAEAIAKRMKPIQLTPFFFNHNQPDLSVVKEKKNVFVFTCHSIEQVKILSPDFFSTVSTMAEKVTCVHFEPFGFQVHCEGQEGGRVSELHEATFRKNGWNLNFAERLFEAEQEGLLKIGCMHKNIIMNAVDNPTSLVLWQNPGAAASSSQ